MSDLATILIYPLQRITALLMSLVISDGITVGALIVAACLLMILFKALVGIHLTVFDFDSRYKQKYDGKEFMKKDDFFTESGGL